MTNGQNILFQSGEIKAMLDALDREVEVKINAIPRSQMLGAPIEDLVEHIMSMMYIESPTIYEEQMVQSNEEIEIRIEARDKRGEVISREGWPCSWY